MLVGLVSDTHGLVRPEIFAALDGVALILHAGDVGGRSILAQLSVIAPVRAVYGNTDPPGEPGLEAALNLELDGLSIHVSHGHELGSPTPEKLIARYKADVIVFGHTHKPLVERIGSHLVVNPGAAGPRRFHLKPSVARLTVKQGRADATIVWL
ncbi:MAG TPA: metallophosphoesterase family protein [Vicinamibacterales bacterium]|nr:metallophosphoesterase family protein [Vicinamibacterales bacterium]